ncbi:MAG: sigma-70 family RNA polymerase sigma factor [Candidatus Binatia bacterium]|nr:sigma-70 family RNA polymerase sigma factor [Candidatus Binatia bacterium]
MSETAPKSDDSALVAQVAGGDPQALRYLYERCSGRAFTVAHGVLVNRGEAQDVVQETFLQVWRQAKRFDARRGGAMAWIVTIARSRAIDRLRARGAADRTVASARAQPPNAPSPSEAAEHTELRERVAGALAELPTEQRRALELAYFRGLSQAEIAHELGDPLSTVKTRVRLGIGKLAALLGPSIIGEVS